LLGPVDVDVTGVDVTWRVFAMRVKVVTANISHSVPQQAGLTR